MAERRMFAKTIIDSDAFLDMPLSSQALYFHLSMRADDDGFLNNPRKIQKMIGASDDDLKLLCAKRFLIPFESGIVVIKHWRIHNYIQSDRYKPTVYTDEKSQLLIKDNGSYSMECAEPEPICIQSVSNTDTTCIQSVSNLDTQERKGKERKEKGKRKDIHAAYAAVIDGFTDNEELKATLSEFVTMRSMINKPMTEKALSLLIAKLKGMSTDNDTQIAILNQSILHNWQSIYPLKEKPTPTTSTEDLEGIL